MGRRDPTVVLLLYPKPYASCPLGRWVLAGPGRRQVLCCAQKGGKWKGPCSFLHPDGLWEPLLSLGTSQVTRDRWSWVCAAPWVEQGFYVLVLTSAGASLGLSANTRGRRLGNKELTCPNCPQVPAVKPQTFPMQTPRKP